MYKVYLSLINIILFYSTYFSQSDYGWKQVIKETLGNDSLKIVVLEYDSEKPIFHAKIKFCKNNLIFYTDSIGRITLPKGNIGIFEVSAEDDSLIGYDPVCVVISDEQIDNITILLNMYSLYSFIHEVKNPKGYRLTLEFIRMLESIANEKAEEDLQNKKVQLYSNFPPNSEQIKFGKDYGIKFIEDYKTPIEYRIKYNKNILIYLKEKYGKNFKNKLKEICWCNCY